MCDALVLNCCDNLGLECAGRDTGLCPELPTCLSTTRQPDLEWMVHSMPNSRWGRFSLTELSHYTVETELNTHTHMDEARLSYSIFYLSTVTEKIFKNSTIAFSFCVFLFPSTLTHFHSLEILQIAHTLARAGGVGKVLPKSFCSWRGRVRWHLFTSFC